MSSWKRHCSIQCFQSLYNDPARGGAASASNPSTLPNTNLKAETTTENEIGIEMSLLDGKLGFDFSFMTKQLMTFLLP